MALLPGSRLGVFEIVTQIGKGGMGEVYSARDTNLDRDVAIKILPADFVQHSERLARFRHEAKTLASLNHPNVATVYDFQHSGDTDYLVMELIEGDTLSERISRTPLSVEEALQLFIQIAQGLDAAHKQGIVHRDLKPDNIKITNDGNAKILDFGLAASVGRSEPAIGPDAETMPGSPPDTALTTDGQILGTPPYMSPEQARGKLVDKRTDIWAYGCCLYEALTGKRPFRGETSTDTLAAILERDPDWDRLPGDTPPELQGIVGRCLEKEPRRRLSDAGDIAVTLEDVVKTTSRESTRGGASRLNGPGATVPSKASLSFGLKATMALAAVALVLFVVVYRGRSAETLTGDGSVAEPREGRAIKSLAVLPFENQSDEEDQKYFVEAMTDALTGELAKIESITVIAPTSTRAYKGTDKPAREIAEELNVEALVEGSVFRAGDTIRIIAKLIDGRTGKQFWSDEYRGNLVDVIQLQSDAALAIAKEISATLTGDERERIASAGPINQEAYEAYVIGHYLLNEATEEGLHLAIRYFKEATVIDPNYAHGWGGLVCAYASFPMFGISHPRDYFPMAREAGLEALALDYDMAGDQSHMGLIAMAYDWEWEQSEEYFLDAIDLSPSGAVGFADYGLFLMMVGRGDEAVEHASTALDLDPHASAYFSQRITSLIYMDTNPERALRSAKRMLAEKPEFYPAMDLLALAYKYLGKHEDAINIAESWAAKVNRDGPSLVSLARALADGGQNERAREVLDEVVTIDSYFDSARVAYAYVALGEFDTAFERLQKSLFERDWGMVELRTMPYWKTYIDDPNWIQFRKDPRYWELIERMKFPPFPNSHPGFVEDQLWRSAKESE